VSWHRFLLIGLLAILAGCGKSSSGGGNTPPPSNTAPVVNAGADQTVFELTTVQLDGAATDADNDPLTYSWTQVSGTNVTINIATTLNADFVAPDVAAGNPEGLIFRLSVSDGQGGTTTDDTLVTVQEPPPPNQVTLSGFAEYEYPPPNNFCDGLNFNAIAIRPIRGAPVQILNASTNAIITSTTTDSTGFYSVTVDGNIDVFVRIRSQLQRSGSPSWDVDVRNNTANTTDPLNLRPLYFLDSAPLNTGGADVTQDLLAGTGWTGASYTGIRAAAPFAVLDTIYEMMQLVVSVDPATSFGALDAFWSPDNNSSPGTGDFITDVGNGDIGTSFYASGLSSLFLLGQDGDDTEEFDDHVIAHEWGHYFEDEFSRSDSIGGPHSIGNQLDKRVAFGEGFATALSGIGLADPMYCDTLWVGPNLRGFEIDIEAEAGGNAGWFNEVSILKFIYDLWDSNDEGGDPMSIGFAPIYNVMTGPQRTNDAFTSVFSFAEALKAQPNAETAFIDSQLAREAITGPGINRYGVGELNDADGNPNDAPGTPPDVLPVYTDISVGLPIRICSNSQFDSGRNGNKLSEVRFLKLDLLSQATLTITVDTFNPATTPSVGYDCTTAPPNDPEIHRHSDPDIQLWRSGQLLVQGWSCQPNREVTQPVNLSPGTYVLDLSEFRYADPQTNTPGGYPEQTCFDVAITQ